MICCRKSQHLGHAIVRGCYALAYLACIWDSQLRNSPLLIRNRIVILEHVWHTRDRVRPPNHKVFRAALVIGSEGPRACYLSNNSIQMLLPDIAGTNHKDASLTAPLIPQDPTTRKEKAHQEKNRRAQKRYRERKKARLHCS